MSWQRLGERIAQLPLVLAGPILRRTELNSVTVWVALREKRRVALHVYHGLGSSRTEVLSGSRDTARIGKFLHIVAVQASAPRDILAESETYSYDLEFDGRERLGSPGIVSMASDASARRSALAYGGDDLPTFALPPKDISRLRLVHGSCRKPHGQGPDALAALDVLIGSAVAGGASALQGASARPHMLFFTGDQIYADDVADALLEALTDAGDTLLGWPQPEGIPPSMKMARDFKPGQRAAVVKAAGFTSGLPHDPGRRKSHLFSFGEFCAMYLFAWSDVLWPPTMPDLGSGKEQKNLNQFRRTLPSVRRALANVPTYMMLDDHEVTDDFFMNREWCYRVFGRPAGKKPDAPLAEELGQRIIQNGLAAYAIFQAWGNTPEQFSERGASGEAGRDLLDALGKWDGTAGGSAAFSAISRRVGVPSARLAPAPSPGGSTSLERLPGHLVWHYCVALPGYPFEVLFLDSRTMRGYPDGRGAFPALLNDRAFRDQLVSPSSATPAEVELTVVISPAPWVGLTWVENWQRRERRNKALEWKHDAEAWGLNRKAFQTMLAALAMRRTRVVVLSGDVHFGFAARVGFWGRAPFGWARPVAERRVANIAQLVASSFKNQTSSVIPSADTDELHVHGFSPSRWLGFALKDNPVDWAGWAVPPPPSALRVGRGGFLWLKRGPTLLGDGPSLLNVSRRRPNREIRVQEDWLYRIQFLKGTKSGTTESSNPRGGPAAANNQGSALQTGEVAEARAKALKGKQGVEVVGLNNIGEVLFEWPADGPAAVTQNLWWGVTDDGNPVVKTSCRVSLDTGEAAFEPAQVWRQPPS